MKISDRFERDGFVFPLDVVDIDKAAHWRAVFEQCEQSWRSHADAAAIKSFAHFVFPQIAAMVTDPRVLDPVSEVLGPDVLCWTISSWIKEPQTSNFVSWHQDLNYWGLDEVDEVTAWIALSPATEQSGCMRFVPGSHKNKIDHNDTFAEDNMLTRGQEVAAEVDEASSVSIELAPGQMSLHHGLLLHASGPNTTDDRRIGLAIRFIKPSMRQVEGDGDMAMLVRGEDRYGHFQLVDPPKTALEADSIKRAVEVHELHQRILYRDTG